MYCVCLYTPYFLLFFRTAAKETHRTSSFATGYILWVAYVFVSIKLPNTEQDINLPTPASAHPPFFFPNLTCVSPFCSIEPLYCTSRTSSYADYGTPIDHQLTWNSTHLDIIDPTSALLPPTSSHSTILHPTCAIVYSRLSRYD